MNKGDTDMFFAKLLIITACICLLSACQIVEKTEGQKAAEIVSKITYVKDTHGVCYATIGSYSYGANIVTSITAVPCDKVGLK